MVWLVVRYFGNQTLGSALIWPVKLSLLGGRVVSTVTVSLPTAGVMVTSWSVTVRVSAYVPIFMSGSLTMPVSAVAKTYHTVTGVPFSYWVARYCLKAGTVAIDVS